MLMLMLSNKHSCHKPFCFLSWVCFLSHTPPVSGVCVLVGAGQLVFSSFIRALHQQHICHHPTTAGWLFSAGFHCGRPLSRHTASSDSVLIHKNVDWRILNGKLLHVAPTSSHTATAQKHDEWINKLVQAGLLSSMSSHKQHIPPQTSLHTLSLTSAFAACVVQIFLLRGFRPMSSNKDTASSS